MVDALESDRAGRRLLGKLRRIRSGIARVIEELRTRVGKYSRGKLGFTSKITFLLDDSGKVSGLRTRLRQDLDNLLDLVVWLNR
jgi:hypothetical protein